MNEILNDELTLLALPIFRRKGTNTRVLGLLYPPISQPTATLVSRFII